MASQGLWAGGFLSLFMDEGLCLLQSFFWCLSGPKVEPKALLSGKLAHPRMQSTKVFPPMRAQKYLYHRQTSLTYK